jgi:hypothetical protein
MASPLQDHLVNAMYSENHAKLMNTSCEQNSDLSLMLKEACDSYHFASEG